MIVLSKMHVAPFFVKAFLAVQIKHIGTIYGGEWPTIHLLDVQAITYWISIALKFFSLLYGVIRIHTSNFVPTLEFSQFGINVAVMYIHDCIWTFFRICNIPNCDIWKTQENWFDYLCHQNRLNFSVTHPFKIPWLSMFGLE